MTHNELTKKLSKYTYVVFYEEESQAVENLLMHTDDNCSCVDVSVSYELKKLVCESFQILELPAMLYRDGLVYPKDDIPSRLDQIDAENIKATEEFLSAFVLTNGVTVFIKGTIKEPYCKFTKQLVALMNEIGLRNVKDFNIFTDEKLRFYMKKVNSWETFPMIYIDGKFVGGLDSFKALMRESAIEEF